MTTAVARATPARWRRELRAFAELFALFGFALTQPLLDLFGRGVEQFALRGASAAQIVAFALGVTFLPAIGVWILEVLVGLVHPSARRALHLGVLAALAAAFAMQAVRPLTSGVPLLMAAIALGLGAAAGYAHSKVVRLWLWYAALAPIGFVALFLFTSPTAGLLDDGSGGERVVASDPAPVVMLVLDELPLTSLLTDDGQIDGELFPNIAELAGDAHWFRNATTVTPATWHAVPAILTGRYPRNDTVPTHADHPDSIFSLLQGSLTMEVTETVTRLCASSICEPQEPSADVWGGLLGDAVRVMRSRLSPTRQADDPTTGFADLTVPPVEERPIFSDLDISQPDRFTSFIDGLDADEPALHLLHILLPHVPYRHVPSGDVYPNPSPDLGRLPEDMWEEGADWPVILGRQRHLIQASYVDNLVGVLLDELRDRNVYDDALVVLTADHGISFSAGGPIRSLEGQPLDDRTTPDVLWVPFFVKEPGQTEGDVSDANVQTVDVLPTIADVLGIDAPFAMDGRSALGAPRSDALKPFYPNDVHAFGVDVLEPVEVDGHEVWPDVLARSVAHFLTAVGDPQRLWKIGPAPELVGLAVTDVGPTRLELVESSLLAPGDFEDVRATGVRPALVRGRVPGLDAGDGLAVAVNGVIGATAPAYPEAGAMAFAVMVDDALLQRGANEVTVYRIR